MRLESDRLFVDLFTNVRRPDDAIRWLINKWTCHSTQILTNLFADGWDDFPDILGNMICSDSNDDPYDMASLCDRINATSLTEGWLFTFKEAKYKGAGGKPMFKYRIQNVEKLTDGDCSIEEIRLTEV